MLRQNNKIKLNEVNVYINKALKSIYYENINKLIQLIVTFF